mmetsp:Transcript_9602/g.24686  ORF Transcript_9602/g.24686 Transcript_9602/m.24686 type:complete len:120 (-) Transcript_9602:314-673(-)
MERNGTPKLLDVVASRADEECGLPRPPCIAPGERLGRSDAVRRKLDRPPWESKPTSDSDALVGDRTGPGLRALYRSSSISFQSGFSDSKVWLAFLMAATHFLASLDFAATSSYIWGMPR